ncbi:MAG TPA: TonB family protein [Kofleriaceae bacterium]|nr:TonB family protein [Kofleriaceae bacterium]
MRRKGAIGASLFAHAFVLAMLPRHRFAPPPAPPVPLTFVTEPRERESNRAVEHQVAVARSAVSAPARRAVAALARSATARPPDTPPRSGSERAEPSPQRSGSEQPGPPGVELFPRAILERHGAATATWGGTRRHAGDGRPPPGTRDGSADAAEAAARVKEWTRGLAGEADALSGRVDPAWRDVERRIDATFRPTAPLITDDNVLTTAIKQLRQDAPTGGPTPRAEDPSRAAAPDQLRAEQIAAAQRAYAAPKGWRSTQIEVTLSADGTVVDVHVVLGSGRAALDALALAAVRRALAARPVRDPRGDVVARFSVEAAVAVQPPTATPVVDPVTQRVTGATVPLLSFSFDESLGKIGFDYPFKRTVHTRTRLISLIPAGGERD